MDRLLDCLRNRSIRFQLFRLVVLASTVALGIAMFGGALLEWRQHRDQVTHALTSAAHSVGIAASAAVAFHDAKAANEALLTLAAQSEIESAALYPLEGYRLASYGAASGLPESAAMLSEHLPDFGPLSARTTLFQPIMLDGAPIGHIYLCADLSGYRSGYLMQALLVVGASLVGLLIAAGLGLRHIDRIVKPVNALAETSRRVRESRDFSLRATPAGVDARRDEVAELVFSFNAMLAEIERRQGEIAEYQGNLETMVLDRTEALRMANRELQLAKEAAEAATEAKSLFLSHMSHEIRTPLNAILGIANLLDSNLSEAKRQLFVTTLRQSSRSLLELVNEVLDLAKIEANRIELEHVDFDLHGLIAESIDLIRGAAQEKGLTTEVHTAPNLPRRAVGDPVRVRQVLNNLLSNAVKFTAAGGVSLQATVERRFGDGFVARIAVADSGIGVPPDLRERIFEAFKQADSSTTRKFGGSGLGLHIARELARRMGGDIRVADGNGGSGATFVFDVVLGKAAAVEEPRAPCATAASADGEMPFAGRSVLVVEDHVPSQLVMREFLEAKGVEVRLANNGCEALERLAERRPDLVLMDCQMPVMDGFEALMRMRAFEASNAERLPMIAITGNAVQRDLERCLLCGADDVLTKPVMPAALDRILAAWLRIAVGREAAETEVPEAPADDAACVIDRRNLRELRAAFKAEHFDVFVGKFDATQAKLLADARAALAANDASAVAAALHALKGGAAYLGAIDVPEICVDLERLARAGRLDAVAARTDELAVACSVLRQTLDEFLDRN